MVTVPRTVMAIRLEVFFFTSIDMNVIMQPPPPQNWCSIEPWKGCTYVTPKSDAVLPSITNKSLMQVGECNCPISTGLIVCCIFFVVRYSVLFVIWNEFLFVDNYLFLQSWLLHWGCSWSSERCRRQNSPHSTRQVQWTESPTCAYDARACMDQINDSSLTINGYYPNR